MSLAQFTQLPVRTIQASATLIEAARVMCDEAVGALVITDASGVTPRGVITDRDLVWMIAEGLNPREAIVGQFIRSALQTVSVTASVSEVTKKMREAGVRRLPIVDQEGRLIGLVSLDDVVALLGRELADAAATINSELTQERRIGAAHKHQAGGR